MIMNKMSAFVIPLVLFLSSCDGVHDDKKNGVEAAAEEFAVCFFSFDLEKARGLSVPESDKWLRFYADNVTDGEVKDFIEEGEGVSCKAVDTRVLTDTSAVVCCEVSGFLDNTSFDVAPRISDSGVFEFNLVKRGNRWLVKMEGLPQNGRQNRD